jgi:hypothetical protein
MARLLSCAVLCLLKVVITLGLSFSCDNFTAVSGSDPNFLYQKVPTALYYSEAESFCNTSIHPNAYLGIIRDSETVDTFAGDQLVWIGLKKTEYNKDLHLNWYWSDGLSWIERPPLWGPYDPAGDNCAEINIRSDGGLGNVDCDTYPPVGGQWGPIGFTLCEVPGKQAILVLDSV